MGLIEHQRQGTFLGCKHRSAMKAGGGSIVNISSIYGLVGAPSAAAYGR